MPSSPVSAVNFYIDGQLAWTEHRPPYFFADDGGWLVTSFLTPGPHEFRTEAVAETGESAQETVTATVEQAAEPPLSLAGRWSRYIPTGDVGVWHVTINRVGWLFDDPHGGGQNQDATYPSRGIVQIGSSIVEPPLGTYDRGGFFCGDPIDPDGEFSYLVSATSDRLTLRADSDVCYKDLVEGSWKRAR